jgi:hypothetical protein
VIRRSSPPPWCLWHCVGLDFSIQANSRYVVERRAQFAVVTFTVLLGEAEHVAEHVAEGVVADDV